MKTFKGYRLKVARFLLATFWSFFFAITTTSVHSATAPSFSWYKTATTANAEFGGDVKFDPQGFIYWGYTRRIPADQSSSTVITKLDPTGSSVWSRTASSSAAGNSLRVAIDQNGNSCFLGAGISGGSGTFYTWLSCFGRFSSAGTAISSLSVSSLFQADGAYPWNCGVTFDSDGNIVLAMPYTSLSYGTQSLQGDPDLALMKLSVAGTVLWIKKVVGPGVNIPTGLVVDVSDNIYLCGYNNGLAAFDAITVQQQGGRDGFIAKYDKSGNVVWVKRPTGNGDDTIDSIAIGKDGSIWFSGIFGGSITIGPKTLSAGTGGSPYIGKIDRDGNFLSAALVNSAIAKISSLGILSDGTAIIAGYVNGSSTDGYIANVDTAGAAKWSKSVGYIYDDYITGLGIGPSGEIAIAGSMKGGITFDGTFVSGNGNEDVFMGKLVDPSVSTLPGITSQPQALQTYFGAAATLSLAVTSSVPVTYQWFFNGAPITAQTNASLSFSSIRPTNDGYYYVEARNSSGTVRSDSVRILVKGDAPVVVSTLAGTNMLGYVDSSNPGSVRFNAPDSPAVLPDGNVLIPDLNNQVIRILEPGGAVGTYAGKGAAGLSNGPASAAYFNSPIAVARDAAWDLYVADAGNNVVRKISAFGARNVSTLAGSGRTGLKNGAAADAEFNFPNDLVVDEGGNVFVTEFNNHTVRKITRDGVVSTFAGTGVAGYRDGDGAQAMFNSPGGIARDGAGNLYVTDWNNHVIRKITAGGFVSTIAGTVGVSGFVDGPALSAKLWAPNGIAVDSTGNIFFTEHWNNSVRRITPTGEVLTLVGTLGEGLADGGRTNAMMSHPAGIALYPDGSLIVADSGNYAMRKVVWQTNAAPTEASVIIELNPSITIFGIPGKTYSVQVTENLVNPSWVILGEVTLGSAVETWYDSQPVTRGQRYYRAVLKN